MRAKDDLSIPLDHLDLCSGPVQAEVTPDRGRDGDETPALYVGQLEALSESTMLDPSQQLFIDAALGAMIEQPAAVLDEMGDQAEPIEEE